VSTSLYIEESILPYDPGNSGERRGKGNTACNTLCDGASTMTRKASAKSALRPNPESSEGEEITIDGCGSIIKLIERI